MNNWIINTKSLFLSKNESNKDKLVNIMDNGIVEIKIKSCSYDNFIKKNDELDKFNIPMRTYLLEGSTLNKKIKDQTIYIIEKDNLKYFITIAGREIRISEYITKETNIYETVINLNCDKYKVSKYTHDLNLSTKEFKWYPNENKLFSMFELEKKETLDLVRSLLNNLEKIENIEEILYPSVVYNAFNIQANKYYNPVIDDDVIFLSVHNENDLSSFNFSIVLKDTKEVVGNINFDYTDSNFSYSGNVDYKIKSEYRNMGYATRALSLLKQLLLQNKKNINLYISTKLDNVASQKVIEKNNGELIYEGEVLKDEVINYIDGIKNVKVYCINIKK